MCMTAEAMRVEALAEQRRPLAAVPTPRSLLDVFDATVAAVPEASAIDAPDGNLSYAQLASETEALASRLRDFGVGAGDRVGVRVASGTADLYVAILAVLRAGAAYVPVDADDPPARAEAVWDAADVCAVVGDDLRIVERAVPQGELRRPTPSDDAWVIFTSGSTGTPNGVVVTHGSAAALVDAEATLWTVEPGDRVLAGLSVGFDASCEEMWLAWRHGATLVPAPRERVRSGVDLGAWLAQRGITVISTVPTLASLWGDDVWDGVRLLILGGEACPAELGWRLAEGREVWNTYGPTEATVVSTAARVLPGLPITIGWPLPGWETAVVDEQGAPVPFGEAGELVIAGVGLGRYLDRGLDARRFRSLHELGWERAYWSGDLVRETPEGLEFLGRNDDQVKLGGRRIELGEIESRLAAEPGVRAAAAAVKKTAAGNSVLVGYVVGEIDAAAARDRLAAWLPDGVVPTLVVLETLPTRISGKVDRAALPWPPPSAEVGGETLDGTQARLAELWVEQLGPLALTPRSDFFELGGSSVAAAKLVSRLRAAYPTVAVADVYHHRTLGDLAARLDRLGGASEGASARADTRTAGGVVAQLAGLFGLVALTAPSWLLAILAWNAWSGSGPRLGIVWLVLGAALFLTAPGRVAIVAVVRRILLGGLSPGRYPRHSLVSLRVWFVDRLTDFSHVEQLAGTPWAARYARLLGIEVGPGARLGTIPAPTGLVSIGAGATIEGDVDMRGWWIDGGELVVGRIAIGADARVGARTLLLPGAAVGEGAEVEPGSVVTSPIPAGERWAGSPAAYRGPAGEGWPATPPPRAPRPQLLRAMFAAGLTVQSLLPVLAALPALVFVLWLTGRTASPASFALLLTATAPLEAASYLVLYGLLVAALVRAVSPLVRPGWHSEGTVGWALWFTGSLMSAAKDGPLFPIFSSLLAAPWLRLTGMRIGRRTEVATAAGLGPLVRYGEKSFSADDVFFASVRSRGGWFEVSPIEVGDGSFLGNGALLGGSTRTGRDSLVGVLTTAPQEVADGTSWLGAPALELPRVPELVDAARTTDPPPRLVAARALWETARILLPWTLSVALGALVYLALEAIGGLGGLAGLVVAAPLVLVAAGFVAAGATVAIKWTLMGRYRPGEHPFWSCFVWRDEIVNSCQESLAGAWLLMHALGTPVMSVYLRAMGASVGRDVWCGTLALTEFDLVELGDGSALNRGSCVQTHLFHDRLMRLGPCTLGPGSTLGPNSAVLPDSKVGAGASVGGRSVVLRGEQLPENSRWHGCPVVAV